jgi:hypothetical protein
MAVEPVAMIVVVVPGTMGRHHDTAGKQDSEK